jgi:hypothetical protein
VIESISLHQEQGDIFSKIEGEHIMWTGAVISYAALHCLFATVFPYRYVYYNSVKSRRPGSLRTGWCLDLPSLKIFFLLWHLKKRSCWTRYLWMLVGPIACVTPPSSLQKLPRPRCWCRSGTVHRNTCCPKSVTYIRFRNRKPALFTYSSQTAYCGTYITSGLLLRI